MGQSQPVCAVRHTHRHPLARLSCRRRRASPAEMKFGKLLHTFQEEHDAPDCLLDYRSLKKQLKAFKSRQQGSTGRRQGWQMHLQLPLLQQV